MIIIKQMQSGKLNLKGGSLQPFITGRMARIIAEQPDFQLKRLQSGTSEDTNPVLQAG